MRQRTPVVVVLTGVTALLASTYCKPCVRLLYNASNSAPRGWYRVLPASPLHVGDYVVTRLPHDIATLAAQRSYLPATVPALKHIAALAGQRVCMRNRIVWIDDQVRARALKVDGAARPMPVWTQCRAMMAGELFLLNDFNPASFDSRYFGPIDASFVIGKAVPFWSRG